MLMCLSTSTCTLHASLDPEGALPGAGGYIQLADDPYQREDGKAGGGNINGGGGGGGGGKDGDSKTSSKNEGACSKLRQCSLS